MEKKTQTKNIKTNKVVKAAKIDKQIAVLIPCYNEEITIKKVISDFKKVLPEADTYVYDNNSSDKTAEIAKKAGAIVRFETRQGKGNVIRAMFRDIEADCYIMVDGDDTYPAKHAREMADAILVQNADMVVGDRLSSTYFEENKRPFHNVGNVLVRKLVNAIFKGNIKDIMTGYRAFSPLFVKTYPVISKGFEIETEMTIHALDKNMKLINILVDYQDRPEGSESKLSTYSDGIKVLRTIGRLFKDYRPLSFFSLVSLVLTLLSAGFAIPVLIDFFETGVVLRFPTLIVCGYVFLTAIISLSCGFILDSNYKMNRQSYETELNKWAFLLRNRSSKKEENRRRLEDI
jgi:glycosyltransferase involved in cell wall biosynthesis